MEFRFGEFNSVYPTPSVPSSSIYTNFFHQVPEEGLRRRSVRGGRPESFREFEKQMIRENILAEEAEQRRVLEAEVRRELMMERGMMSTQRHLGYASSLLLVPPQSHNNRFYPGILHGETWRLEVVPFERRPQSPEITDNIISLPKVSEKKFIDLGKPNGPTSSGAKRKQPPPPSPAVGGSIELCYRSKKKANEWSCALCKVNTTCELDLEEHLAGKKHQANAAGLSAVKKVVSNHKKGKRHLKNHRKSRRNPTGKTVAN